MHKKDIRVGDVLYDYDGGRVITVDRIVSRGVWSTDGDFCLVSSLYPITEELKALLDRLAAIREEEDNLWDKISILLGKKD